MTATEMTGGASARPQPRAADLIRDVGLMADGPVRWGRPVSAHGSGIFIVELALPLAAAPIELTRVGKWLERVPDLRLDGEHPLSKALAARLASFWLADATILYVGSSTAGIGARIGSLTSHVLGDRRPHPDGHWLQTLRGLEDLRVWWAATRAPEEALDAVFDAFAAAGPTLVAGRPAKALVLPWANSRRPTGERQPHGLTSSLIPDPVAPPAPPSRVVELAPGDADGATKEARGTGTTRRTGTPVAPRTARRPAAPKPATPPRPRAAAAPKKYEAKREPIPLSSAAVDRLAAELDDLTRVQRPQVVARIKAARELGDLKENADYQAAREEQSFLEGRVRLLEDRLRYAVIVDEGPGTHVVLGSIVTLEHAGDEITYTIVSSSEADPAGGRLSSASPVGAALVGATVGQEVEVRTPRGPVRYRVVAIG